MTQITVYAEAKSAHWLVASLRAQGMSVSTLPGRANEGLMDPAVQMLVDVPDCRIGDVLRTLTGARSKSCGECRPRDATLRITHVGFPPTPQGVKMRDIFGAIGQQEV